MLSISMIKAIAQTGNCPQPSYCDRTCWDPSGTHPEDLTPTFTIPSHIVVHHSGSNYSSGQNYSQVIKSIWNYHVNTKNWDDIAYNWLIDPNGVIYEGRGDGVMGSHFSCMNSNTTGICVIGDFQSASPSTSAINKLKELLAWETTDKNINITSSSFHNSSSLVLNHIVGHKDGNNSSSSCGATVCPGTNLYNQLSSIKSSVANLPCYSSSAPPPPPSNDNCSNAIQLTSNTSCNYTSGTVLGATSSYGPNSCSNYLSQDDYDVYYKFTPTCSSHTIKLTYTAANFDAVVELRSACGYNQQIECYDPSGAPSVWSHTFNNLPVGQVVYVRVYEFNYVATPPTSPNFNICITHSCSQVSPPSTPTISGNNQICQGHNTTLSVSNICSGCTYQWSNGQSGTSINVSAGNYSVTATNSGGSTTSSTFNVSTSNGPNVFVSPSNPSICAGQSVQITASGASSYVWSNGMNGSSITINSPGNYTVTGTDNNGCTGTASVQVSQSNGPNVTLTASPSSINSGGSSNLTVSPSNGQSYQWTPSNVSGANPSVSPTVTTTYSVIVTDFNGCTGSASTTINVTPLNCNNSSATLSSYQANFDAEPSQSSGSFNVNFNPSASNCTYSVSSGCNWVTILSPTNAQSQSAIVSFNVADNLGVQRICTLTISTGNNNYYFVINQSELGAIPCSLSQPVINESGAPFLAASSHQNISYQWFFNGNAILGETGQYFTATSNGCFTVKIFDNNDNTCFYESNPVCINNVGIEKVLELESISVFPNPNDGNFNISFELLKSENVKIELFSNLGKLIFEKSYGIKNSGINEIAIKSPFLTTGIYFIKLKIGEKYLSQKILIE